MPYFQGLTACLLNNSKIFFVSGHKKIEPRTIGNSRSSMISTGTYRNCATDIISESAPKCNKGDDYLRGESKTQMYCISENNGAMFELKMNEALENLKNPDIRMDPSKPFTAYIFFKIEYDVPESVTEAMELITGERHFCIDCPACELSKDKRRRWHRCTKRGKRVHEETPVCMEYYRIVGAKEFLKDPNDLPQLNY